MEWAPLQWNSSTRQSVNFKEYRTQLFNLVSRFCSNCLCSPQSKYIFLLPAAVCITMRSSLFKSCQNCAWIFDFYLSIDMEYFSTARVLKFELLFCTLSCLTWHVLTLSWCAYLTLQDWESLLSLWNQDCWAWRHSAPVITPSLSWVRPINTDRAVSLSLAVNTRTSEF